MKKILSVAAVLCCLTAFSQNSTIKFEPTIAQGYLVLDKANNPDVERWEVATFKRTYNPDNSHSDLALEQANLNGRNYLKIPNERLRETNNTRFFVTIAGYTSANVKIIEETKAISRGVGNGPPFLQSCPGCEPFTRICEWKCNGQGYAWEIAMSTSQNGGSSILSLYSTVDYFDEDAQLGIPFYQWMGDAAFQNMCANTQNWSDFTNACIEDGLKIIRFGNIPSGSTDYFDIGNNPLSGIVWGVMKRLGPWKNSVIQTGQLTIQPWECSNPRSFAITAMNNYGDFTGYPDLECLPAWGADDLSGSGLSGGCAAAINSFVWGVDGDLYDLLTIMATCDGNTNTGDLDWWDLLEETTIIRVDYEDDDTQPILINAAKLFNSNQGGNGNGGNNEYRKGNGKINAPVFEVPPGLYTIGVRMKGGKYIPIVKEVLQMVTNKMDQSTVLDVKIYPSPITDDRFDITLKADAKVRVDYYLIDFYGNELHKRTFALQNDLEVTHKIKPTKAMPNGILMHRFVFEDGSVKVMQTLRD